MNYGMQFMALYRRQGSRPSPWKRNAKAGSQQIPGAKANRLLPRKHTGHGKHPLPTTQEMTLHMDITTWSILKSD